MPKDYFEDITPPASTSLKTSSSVPVSQKDSQKSSASRLVQESQVRGSTDRSIRDIVPSRPRLRSQPPITSQSMWNNEGVAHTIVRHSRWWIWVVAVGALLILGGVLIFAFRPTVVTVTPRAHTVMFDASNRYSAYPVATAPAGSLAYTLETLEFEDSAPVSAEGVERVEEKAHGVITVINEYSASSVRLIKNTRFQTPQGLVFRVPNTVVVPGKKGTVGGSVSVEVYADQPGEQYNIGPVTRFTLPGLKSSPDMFSTVYARSGATFSGGFVGERPRVAPSTLERARAEVRTRLEERAAEALLGEPQGLTIPGLLRTVFVSQSLTSEAGGGVRIHEKATVVFPVFTAETFALVMAKGISADAENAIVRFVPQQTFAATADASALAALETGPFPFSLGGEGTIVFTIDSEALVNALLGREKSAFEAIVSSFPGIETAHARVSPLWTRSFPDDPDSLTIVVEDPLAQ